MRRAVSALALAVLLAGCSANARSISGYGLSLDLPNGWTGEVYRRGKDLVVLHAASFRLGPHAGYDPMGTIERGGRLLDARVAMPPHGAGVSVFAYSELPGEPFPRVEGALQLRPRDRTSLEGWPSGRAAYQRLVSMGGRQLEVVATFGSKHPSPELVQRLNEALRTLTVGS
jgi:hypothetical protein